MYFLFFIFYFNEIYSMQYFINWTNNCVWSQLQNKQKQLWKEHDSATNYAYFWKINKIKLSPFLNFDSNQA